MDRLTNRINDVVLLVDDVDGRYTANEVIDMLAERLAAYEDIGLSPEHVKEMYDDATAMSKGLPMVKAELEAAKRDIAALLWLNGNCEYCKYGRKEEYSGASRWTCGLGSGSDCYPEWRGKEDV